MSLKYTITHNGNTWTSSSDLDTITLSNGSVTSTITEAGTRVLNCAGKYMPNNIVIGDKTLNCAGKIITGNITIVAENSGPVLEGIVLDQFYLTDSGLSSEQIESAIITENMPTNDIVSNSFIISRNMIDCEIVYDL